MNSPESRGLPPIDTKPNENTEPISADGQQSESTEQNSWDGRFYAAETSYIDQAVEVWGHDPEIERPFALEMDHIAADAITEEFEREGVANLSEAEIERKFDSAAASLQRNNEAHGRAIDYAGTLRRGTTDAGTWRRHIENLAAIQRNISMANARERVLSQRLREIHEEQGAKIKKQ